MQLLSFIPNQWRILVLALAGIGIEVALALTTPGHALWLGGAASLLAAGYLLWFWLTLAVSARLGAHAWQRFAQHGTRPQRWIVGTLLLSGLVTAGLIYIVSWGAFLQTARFANWESVRFTIANFDMLSDYLRAADGKQFAWAAAAVMVLAFAIPAIGRWLADPDNSPQTGASRRLAAWFMLVLGLCLFKNYIGSDISIHRRVTRLDRLTHALNPAVTLVATGWDAVTTIPVEPCLQPAELIPLEAAKQWQEKVHAEKLEKPPSIIIVAIESLRHDMIDFRHQNREVLPNINALARDGLQLTRAYAQSTHSDYADVCLASSLYPLRTARHHYYRPDDPWPKTLLHDLLHERGYSTAVISSQNEAWGGMDAFLQTPGLDWFYDPRSNAAASLTSDRDPGFARERRAGTLLAGKFPDRHTTDVALKWIGQQENAGRPFYLALNFQSSHFPYLIPDDAPRLFHPCELPSDVKFSSYPVERVPLVRNAYYNALHEADRQVGRLVNHLRELHRLDDTILVVTGENGEAFHENGSIGHACNPTEPVIHVAAVIHAPDRIAPAKEDYPFEHIDLAPTLLGLIGLPCHPNFQGINIFKFDRQPADERLLYFHVHSPIAMADAVMQGGRWKFVVTHEQPQGALFDVSTDPSESYDLSASQPTLRSVLATTLQQWRDRQLAYYHYPQFYRRYFPPAPPHVKGLQPSVRLSAPQHFQTRSAAESPANYAHAAHTPALAVPRAAANSKPR